MESLSNPATFGGTWVGKAGPRKAMFASAVFFSLGFFISAFGIMVHNIWIVYLGQVSPVKTLISWFPDRPGMATGLTIMCFSGGAMIGSPLAVALMDADKTDTSKGVMETFLTMGLVYFLFMMWGVITVRVPDKNWNPRGFTPKPSTSDTVSKANVSAAGVAGPALVNYIRKYQISQGVPPAQSYSFTMYLMAGLLVLGFVCNWRVKPVDPKFYSAELVAN